MLVLRSSGCWECNSHSAATRAPTQLRLRDFALRANISTRNRPPTFRLAESRDIGMVSGGCGCAGFQLLLNTDARCGSARRGYTQRCALRGGHA